MTAFSTLRDQSSAMQVLEMERQRRRCHVEELSNCTGIETIWTRFNEEPIGPQSMLVCKRSESVYDLVSVHMKNYISTNIEMSSDEDHVV